MSLSQRQLYIQTPDPHALAEAAGEAAGRNGSCWACGNHDKLLKTVVHSLSKHPLMGINVLDPDEDPEARCIQKSCWKAFKKASPLCEKCSEHPIFFGKMYKDPDFINLAAEAGQTAGRENGGCTGCGFHKDEERMAEVIVLRIHPTKPLLQIGEYEGKKVRELRTAFIQAYHKAAPESCSNCQPEE